MTKNNELLDIQKIYNDIRKRIIKARSKIYTIINNESIDNCWYIGKIVVELQNGNSRAEYGKQMIKTLSEKLTNEFGAGFSMQNIRKMRQFYEAFPIRSTVSSELSWSHYQELSKIVREEERSFYYVESINSNWSVRELQRQKNSKLYDRLLLSTEKNKVRELSEKGLVIKKPEDVVKNPFVLEFAGLKENTKFLETELEKALLTHLSDFLLELGNGFSFIGSQKRINLDGDYFYPDLLFYNRLAKCFVIIDLKIGKLTHQDIGQMQMYVNYYKTQMVDGENEPIGILLCAEKNDTVVEMTLGDNKNIYTSKYITYLPTKEQLIAEIESQRAMFEAMEETEDSTGLI